MSHKEKSYNQLAGRKVERIETLSDGIFAIAMTLLVLDLKVPLGIVIKTEHDLIGALCAISPKLLSYFMSFMTLGIFWTGHSTQYHYIDRSDRNMNWITVFFLMSVSILPFTTSILSEHIALRTSIILYWLNILLLGVFIYINWVYAYHKGFVHLKGEDKEMVNKALRRRIIIAQLLYAGGAALCFVNNYLSIGVIVAIQLNYAFGLISGWRGKVK